MTSTACTISSLRGDDLCKYRQVNKMSVQQEQSDSGGLRASGLNERSLG